MRRHSRGQGYDDGAEHTDGWKQGRSRGDDRDRRHGLRLGLGLPGDPGGTCRLRPAGARRGAFRRRRRSSRGLPCRDQTQAPGGQDLWRFGVGGFGFVALYTGLLNYGELTVSAGAASFIINVSPILTALFATAFLSERFSVIAWGGTLLSFAGIGIIALGEGEGLRFDAGALLILGAAFVTSANAIAQKPLFTRHDPLAVSAWNMVVGALALSPFLPSGLAQAAVADAHGLFAAVYLGIVPSLIAYASWAVALSRLPASRASNFLYCVPPVATLMGFLWLGEQPGLLGIAGGALALVGVASSICAAEASSRTKERKPRHIVCCPQLAAKGQHNGFRFFTVPRRQTIWKRRWRI